MREFSYFPIVYFPTALSNSTHADDDPENRPQVSERTIFLRQQSDTLSSLYIGFFITATVAVFEAVVQKSFAE